MCSCGFLCLFHMFISDLPLLFVVVVVVAVIVCQHLMLFYIKWCMALAKYGPRQTFFRILLKNLSIVSFYSISITYGAISVLFFSLSLYMISLIIVARVFRLPIVLSVALTRPILFHHPSMVSIYRLILCFISFFPVSFTSWDERMRRCKNHNFSFSF